MDKEMRNKMKKLIKTQYFLLLAGTIFAWGNFFNELNSWLNDKACTTGCSAGLIVNPFKTPCFYGAMFFLLAFLISALMMKGVKNCKCDEGKCE